ncbi:MAG: hypothetical protein IPL49_04675 [Saprospirales bacterium]|nr:hypothetical protein [Saprospirales bacterium]
MKKIVVLTGAGISQESGIPTFRDAGGLWEGHRVEDVATPAPGNATPNWCCIFTTNAGKKSRRWNPMTGTGHW